MEKFLARFRFERLPQGIRMLQNWDVGSVLEIRFPNDARLAVATAPTSCRIKRRDKHRHVSANTTRTSWSGNLAAQFARNGFIIPAKNERAQYAVLRTYSVHDGTKERQTFH